MVIFRQHFGTDCTARTCARAKSSRGSVYFEAILTIPLIIFVTFCGIEAANWLRVQESLSQTAREAIELTYRNCRRPLGLLKNIDNSAVWTACLTQAAAQVQSAADVAVPNISVATRFWVYGLYLEDELKDYTFEVNDIGSQPELEVVLMSQGKTVGATSRLSTADFNLGSSLYDLVTTNRYLITVELFVPYTPLSGFAGRLMGFTGGEVYAVAVAS